MLCAGLGRHLKGAGKKVGFFKPMVADISRPEEAVDTDTEFMKRILDLKEPLENLCPVIGGNIASEVKKAYDRVAEGKDVVIIEGVWRQRPGGRPIEAAYEVVKALDAKVLVVEPYSEAVSINKYRDFGEYLLGVVVNKVPVSRVEAVREQLGGADIDILGVLPEDRLLFSLTVGELAERVGGKILNDAEKSSELVDNFMLGALTVDSGLDYFGRKDNKAVVVRAERPDMQLAALETSTRCLVLSGDAPPSHPVLKGAKAKGIPIIATGNDVNTTVMNVEQALGRTKFNQAEKLPRLAGIMEPNFDFQALYKGLGLATV
jgi:BioD-like phosphotransacetylase family protein